MPDLVDVDLDFQKKSKPGSYFQKSVDIQKHFEAENMKSEKFVFGEIYADIPWPLS